MPLTFGRLETSPPPRFTTAYLTQLCVQSLSATGFPFMILAPILSVGVQYMTIQFVTLPYPKT